MKKTPTNLIIGNLGSGKTATILDLLKQKPSHEKWVIVQNEFGNTEIADIFLAETQSKLVKISTIAGGCACCSDGVNLEEILLKIVSENPPDRLIIELGATAHVTRILDTLRWKDLGEKILVQMTVCLVDSEQLNKSLSSGSSESEILNFTNNLTQNNITNILIFNQLADIPEEAMRHFNGVIPPKLAISRDKLSLAWLDCDPWNLTQSDVEKLNSNAEIQVKTQESPRPKKPKFTLKNEGEYWTGTWIFNATDVFEMGLLSNILLPPMIEQKIIRVLGIIRINTEWFSYELFDFSLVPKINISTHRWDSYLVMTTTQALDWEEITQKLVACTISEDEWQINYEAMLKQYLPVV